MNKKCFKCQEEKDELLFKKKQGKISTCCKTCFGRYYHGKRKWKGSEKVRGKVLSDEQRKINKKNLRNKLRKKYIEKCRLFLLEYWSIHCCVDCGESDIIVLEFDHRNPKEKSGEVGKLAALGKFDTMLTEISKCDVVCSNCHAKRTAKMFGSWRLDYNLLAAE
jgi:hypothetical protein